MAIVTTYPGVYIGEDASPVISVSSQATAVPVIAIHDKFSVMTRIVSFLDYLEKIGGDFNPAFTGDVAVRAYFEHGGAPCYVINGANIASQVPNYPDISLVVSGFQLSSATMNELCYPGSGRFGLFDYKNQITSSSDIGADFSSSSCAAVYYPVLNADWATTDIPVSAVMAGLYCRSDRERGVWKAPANIPLSNGYIPKYRVSDDLQGQFNSGLAVNMIREQHGQGVVVWGARTLEDSDNWRYIPVRRLFISAERDIKNTMGAMVFEPNTAPTWEKIRTAITNYLHNLWQQGALLGTTAKDAYFVKIGLGVTMTDDDVAQGRMIATVGMAAVRPAEFIILQFTQNVEQQ